MTSLPMEAVTGLEPAYGFRLTVLQTASSPFGHIDLNDARLPIPPQVHRDRLAALGRHSSCSGHALSHGLITKRQFDLSRRYSVVNRGDDRIRTGIRVAPNGFADRRLRPFSHITRCGNDRHPRPEPCPTVTR